MNAEKSTIKAEDWVKIILSSVWIVSSPAFIVRLILSLDNP
jgi:hypothetical protein